MRPSLPTSEHVVASIRDPAAGTSYCARRLTSAIGRRGAKVGLRAVSGWREHDLAEEDPPDVTYAAYRRDFAGLPLLNGACLSSDLFRAVRNAAQEADIVHSHGLWLMPNIYPAWAVRGRRAKLVMSPHGMLGAQALAFSSLKKQAFWRLFQGEAARRADCVHATSEAEYADIRAMGLKNPVAVIAHGVDLPMIEPTDAANGPRTVLTLGRIHPKKGLDRLIQAWAKVEREHPKWRLRIVGPAELDHDRQLRRLCDSLNLRRVSIEGPAYGADRLAAYSAADVFVLATHSENFAMTVAEALAAGTPVISTKGAPWADLRTEGCGWWIEHGAESLAAALRAAMAMPRPALQAMGAKGRAWMARDFSWDRVAADILDVYSWLARGTQPPASIRWG